MAGGDVGGGKGKVDIYIDMTPMVDVIILLLIFFFMTSQFKEPAGVEINLPKSESQVKVKESNTVIVRVEADGKVYIGGRPPDGELIEMKDLKEEIAKRQANNENMITILDVSHKAKYSDMVNALDEFKMAAEETGVKKFSLQLEDAALLEEEAVVEGEESGE